MAKWLAAAGVLVVGLVVFLLVQLHQPAEAAVAAPKATPAPTPIEVATKTAKQVELAEIGKKVAAATTTDGKVSKASDEFFYRFDDLQPSMLTRNAAKCYTGGLHRVHRNQKVKLAFDNVIKDGEVTVTNVRVVESTIDDQPMIDCFVKAVQDTHWHDDTLPDYSAPDELVIRPERGMKKWTEENLKYEGSGPDFTHRAPGT